MENPINDLNKDILLASKNLNLWEASPRTWASHPHFTTFISSWSLFWKQ